MGEHYVAVFQQGGSVSTDRPVHIHVLISHSLSFVNNYLFDDFNGAFSLEGAAVDPVYAPDEVYGGGPCFNKVAAGSLHFVEELLFALSFAVVCCEG